MPRTDFTAEQKATIFALDRATCTYSGRNLWIADFGIDPAYHIDWADHVIPSSRGGPSSVKNGAAAGWLHNYLRGKDQQRLALYHRGLPTEEHTLNIGVLDQEIASRLERFAKLVPADWYLNRAMWHVWIAVAKEHERRKGAKISRDYDYYARCSLNSLSKWRRVYQGGSMGSLEERDLLPHNPEADQVMLLETRDANTAASLVSLMKSLFARYEAASKAITSLSQAGSSVEIKKTLEKAELNKLIPRRIYARLAAYGTSLQRLLAKASA